MKIIISESQQASIIRNFLEPYEESGCVKTKTTSKYMVVDVESASYFKDMGFEERDCSMIKKFLIKNGFIYSFGDYIKEL